MSDAERHPVAQIAVEAYASWFRPDATLEQIRDGFDHMAPDPPADISVTETEVGGVPGRWVAASDAGDGVIIHVHGGGFTAGSSYSHRDLAGRLARASGCRVLLPDYALSPETKYPRALDDILAVYRAVAAEQAGTGAGIVLSGDSSGGGLALAAAMALRDQGEPLPAGLALMSPFADLTVSGDSIVSRASLDPLSSGEVLSQSAAAYLQGADPRDPLVSPVLGSFSGLPPLLVQVGTSEVLEDDTVRVAERAAAAGVQVTARTAYQMVHLYHLFAYDERVPEAQRDIAEIGQFARSVTASGQTDS